MPFFFFYCSCGLLCFYRRVFLAHYNLEKYMAHYTLAKYIETDMGFQERELTLDKGLSLPFMKEEKTPL